MKSRKKRLGINPKDALGVKKTPFRFVPPIATALTAEALADGNLKYQSYNWRENAVRYSVYLEAALRHIYAVMDGEELAEDSGIPHIAHASACMAILMDAQATGNLIDDRDKSGMLSRVMKVWNMHRRQTNNDPAPRVPVDHAGLLAHQKGTKAAKRTMIDGIPLRLSICQMSKQELAKYPSYTVQLVSDVPWWKRLWRVLIG